MESVQSLWFAIDIPIIVALQRGIKPVPPIGQDCRGNQQKP